MEKTAGNSSGMSAVVTRYDDGRAFITDNELPSSMHAVMSNDDLLIEILLRLPVISLVLFKTVSKRWLSLINDTKFTMRRRQIPNLDYPSGLFLWFNLSFKTNYIFVPLDMRIPIRRSYQHIGFTFLSQTCGSLQILQSCNGLLLCCFTVWPRRYYVYNPTINLFKILPGTDNFSPYDQLPPLMRMAFDPAKSPNYKVVYSELTSDQFGPYIQIQTYFSQTRNWKVSCGRYPTGCFSGFNLGIYWNDAIHWLCYLNTQYLHCKLDISNEHPILANLQLPITLDGNVDSDCKLFDSCGCLLLLCRNNFHSPLLLNIYEMRNGSSEWSMKYFVKLDEIMRPFPDTWSISSIYCIVSGEREEDSFIVMKLNNNVVQYKIVSKTLRTLADLGSVGYLISRSEFIASFARV